MADTDLSAIIATVRQAGPAGCSLEAVCGATGLGFEAVKKALALQIEAGLMSTEELFDGERFLCTIYRMREGA